MKSYRFFLLFANSILITLTSCNKEEEAISAVHCVNEINYLGDYLQDFSDTDSLWYYSYPSFNREKIFIPSAFTPNNDYLNDNFITFIDLKDSTENYQAVIAIYYHGLLKHAESANFNNSYYFTWEFPNEEFSKRLYDVYLVIGQNGQELHNFHSQFWALRPDQNGYLPHWSQCLTFGDQYDSRLGLIYPTIEKFRP